jgi:hypothetical protein
MLGSVEATPADNRYYTGPFWLYIIDRQGRIVWYYSDIIANPCMAFPRIARDGSYIYIEKRMFGDVSNYEPRVLKMTLDHRFFEEIPVPLLNDCFDVTDEGTILFNTVERRGESLLKEMLPDGTIRPIWDCRQWTVDNGVRGVSNACYSNTVNWNALADTVLMSMPYLNTALEIDRQTGALVSQWGSLSESFEFDPVTWELEFNHYANITPDGTLVISSHEPGHSDTREPGQHYFMEFDIDQENEVLTERWVFGDDIDDWPMYKGEAYRMPGGNTLANYGTGGVIREITPDKETAWHVKWDAAGPNFQDDHFNYMVGHNILIDDLYALCNGWEE